MTENYRRFEVSNPDGRSYMVEYRWQQTAISIRHSDTVDVKFLLLSEGLREEKVVALQLTDLMKVSQNGNRPMTDAWCMKLAALHLKQMIETDLDMDKVLVTPSRHDLASYSQTLAKAFTVRL